MTTDEYCDNFDDHEWQDGYYGLDCKKCGMFIPYGSEPWMPVEEYDTDLDYEWEAE